MNALLGITLFFSTAAAGLGDGDQLAATDTPEIVGVLPEGVGIPVGQPAVDADVLTRDGQPTTLLAGPAQPRLIVFYRGGWCPYCNSLLRSLTLDHQQFLDRNVSIVAISVEKPDAAAQTAATWEIPFTVLSDPQLNAHKRWNVLEHLGGAQRVMLGVAGAKLKDRTGRKDGSTATSSIYYVDQNNIVRWAHADSGLKDRPSPQQILDAIDQNEPRQNEPRTRAAAVREQGTTP